MAVTIRTPFDFSAGESELVSGFNVEYRRGGFVLIFWLSMQEFQLEKYNFVLFFFWADISIH